MSIFTKVKMPSVGSSKFNLTHDKKMSFDMGELIPTCVMDVLPGDKFRINVETMLRFSPLISPVMHKYKVKTDYFFCPNRLVWNGWEDFITGESDNAPPTFTSGANIFNGKLGDYIGYTQAHSVNQGSIKYNALPIAAYAKIYDEYYRDENLITEESATLGLVTGSSNNTYRDLAHGEPLKRAWMHDYLTSCLPFSQKGDAVKLPLINDDTIPVVFDPAAGTSQKIRYRGGGSDGDVLAEGEEWHLGADVAGVTGDLTAHAEPDSDFATVDLDLSETHVVNINAEAALIEDLRTAFRLQEWLEKNARGGTRYTEHIKAHFGVFSSDQRMQRPEYIGGYSQNMVISEVLATAETEGTANIPVGEMAGHGISVGHGQTFTYRAEEHGFIIGIISVCPVTAYDQGLIKMFNRPSFMDYYFPSFANLGEQEVLNMEVYIGSELIADLESVFGYIPRYAEYKYMNSSVHGDFKLQLNFWQHGRTFASAPALNKTFIECNPDKRIFAVTDGNDSIYAYILNKISAVRKMPKYAMPSI